MTRIEKVRTSFLRCTGPFKWLDFERLLVGCGYELRKSSGGSARTYVNATTLDVIRLHEPHDGVMGPAMVTRLRDHLKARGVL